MKYIPPLNALPGDEADENRSHWNAEPSGINSALRSGAFPSAIGFEACQREIVNVIEEADLEPDPEDYTQLYQAIMVLILANTPEVPEIPEYEQYAIGQPFPIWDGLPGAEIPDNSGVKKYIKLTAGLTGVGGYNQGLLTNEVISGSAPTLEATAEIAVGDNAGSLINLINTEGRYLKPGVNPGSVANDQMQRIQGSISSLHASPNIGILRDSNTLSGAFSAGGTLTQSTGSTTITGRGLNFDSASSAGARTGTYTDVKHIQSSYYVRII
jgi:hypothetical protein